MATEALPKKNYAGNILEAFLPKKATKSTTTGTETTKTDVTAEGINDIIRQMMEGNNGLAALLQRQQGAGLYNSTTAQLLANDLAARVGEKAATASAPTTRTATQTKKEPGTQIDPLLMLGLKIAGELFGGSDSKSSGGKPNQIGAGFDNLFGTNFFGGKKPEDKFDPNNNYSGFGFTDQNFADFNLGGFNPDYGMALGSGGYTPNDFSLTGGGDWLLGTGYSGSLGGGNNFSASPYLASNYSLGVGNTGLGSSGISFGFSF